MPSSKLYSLEVFTFTVPIVFYTLWERCRVTNLIPWECPHSMLLLCFARFERIPGNKLDSLGVPTFDVPIAFYTLWERCRVTKLIPWECPHSTPVLCFTPLRGCRVTGLIPYEYPHSTFLLSFTRFERMPGNKLDSLQCPHTTSLLCFTRFEGDAGYQSCSPGSAQIQRFYYVSHALTGCQVTNLIPWGCPHSMLLLCFTRFERLLGNKLESLGVATFNVSIMFYTLWVNAR